YGLLSGKLGNRVYYVVDGKQLSRRTGRATKPPTEGQTANRYAMKVAMAFVKTIGTFADLGFAREALDRNIHPRNAAVSYIRKKALKGQYPDIDVDYTRLLL